jgi:hypothetical protein
MAAQVTFVSNTKLEIPKPSLLGIADAVHNTKAGLAYMRHHELAAHAVGYRRTHKAQATLTYETKKELTIFKDAVVIR